MAATDMRTDLRMGISSERPSFGWYQFDRVGQPATQGERMANGE
jgi:hypothetical protein